MRSRRIVSTVAAAFLLASPARAQQPEPLDGPGRVFQDSPDGTWREFARYELRRRS